MLTQEAAPATRSLIIKGDVDLTYIDKPFALTVCVDGREIDQQRIERSGDFKLELPLPHFLSPGPHTIEVQASDWYVSHRFTRNRDFRPLAWRIHRVEFTPDDSIQRVFQEYYKIPCPPTGYYSPLPDIDKARENLPRWYKEGSSVGIDWNLQGQKELLQQLAKYKDESASLPSFEDVSRAGYGEGYGEVEAHFLHLLVRYFKPRKIIEVGSGSSTFFTLNALQMNNKDDGVVSDLICVEPYPSDELRELVKRSEIALYDTEVQNLDVELFRELDDGDMLFIDSSHVTKVDSDVNFLYLEVLPNLRKGVIIHVHDMPFPFPGLPRTHPLFDTYLFWNESSIVKAFLLFNSAFDIVMCQSFLHYNNPESIKSIVSLYDGNIHFPSSLWLIKRV